jgi:threonine dehydrogenase-like Zn-dependent dehydrogenase
MINGSEFDSLAKVAEQVKDFLNGELPDVVIDNTGDIEVIREAYRPTVDEGRTILVGVPPHDRETRIATLPLHFGKVITGSHGGESRPERDIPRYLRLWKAEKLRLESLITTASRSRKSITLLRECAQVLRSADHSSDGSLSLIHRPDHNSRNSITNVFLSSGGMSSGSAAGASLKRNSRMRRLIF